MSEEDLLKIIKDLVVEAFPSPKLLKESFMFGHNTLFCEGHEFSTYPTYLKIKKTNDEFKIRLFKFTQDYINDFYKVFLEIRREFDENWKGLREQGDTSAAYDVKHQKMSELWDTYLPLEASICVPLGKLLMRSNIQFNETDILEILNSKPVSSYFPLPFFLKRVEDYVKQNGLSEAIQSGLSDLLKSINFRGMEKEKLKAKEILALGELTNAEDIDLVLLDDQDEFGRMINAFIASQDLELRRSYSVLFDHFKKSTSRSPNKKSITAIQQEITKIGKDKYAAQLKIWLDFLSKFDVQTVQKPYTYQTYGQRIYFSKLNQVAIKGLLLSTSDLIDSEILQLLRAYAERCFRKIPGQGTLAQSVGNTCLDILSQADLEGINHLSRLRHKVKQSDVKKTIDYKIKCASEVLNLTSDEVEDLSIQDYGISSGKVDYILGDYKAEIVISEAGKTQVHWFNADGKKLKSKPAALDKAYAEQIKTIRNLASEIQQVLTSQRERLNFSIINERRMSFAHFQDFYFNHSLLSLLTRKLIWSFINPKEQSEFSALYVHENWLTADGRQIAHFNDNLEVQLWNPIDKSTEEVLAWRKCLQDFEIQQPFKQAHREVYILTDAERRTETYSNRMAAHILKQYQFNSLANLRGWSYSLLGAFDGVPESSRAWKYLPKHNITAEFWVNAVQAENEFSSSGMWNFVSTDQIRFYQHGRVLNLETVPSLVFSEIIRDVDLFVGVASVGNDPNWQDNPLRTFYENYWHDYSFGELSEIGKTRKSVLENLIPRLKIASSCQVQDKFLVVKGSIRTYKIHLGSGNILMEPNDQYLCIVPDQASKNLNANKIFLPFEGDNTLSIILSKAFLLAEDSKITDPTIVSQLTG